MRHLIHLIPFVVLGVVALGIFAAVKMQRRRPAPVPKAGRPPLPGDRA